MKKILSVIRSALCAAVAASGASAFAEEVVAGYQETRTVNVADDAVQADPVVLAPRGAVRKTGEGEWTVPTSALFLQEETKLEVADGALKLQPAAAPAAAAPDGVSNILAKAGMWFDVRNAASLVKSGDNVTEWLDTREKGTAGSYAYGRGVADVQFFEGVNEKYPVVQTDAESGLTGLYFGGPQSGRWMKFLTPSDKKCDCYAYHVFVVHGVRTGLGNILGLRKGDDKSTYANTAFFAGNSSAKTFSPLWMMSSDETPAIATARTYVNGAFYEGMRVGFYGAYYDYPKGYTLLEAELLRKPGRVNCFYNDRGYTGSYFNGRTMPAEFQSGGSVRQGGDYLGEVVLFTNRLTTAERLAVGRYLTNKWFGVQRPAKLDLAAADAGSVELVTPEEGQESLPWSMAGDGALVKNDTDDTLLPRDSLTNFVGHLVLGANADAHHWGDYPFALAVGRKYYSADANDRRYTTARTTGVAADTCETYGSGEIKVDAVATNVAKLKVQAGTLRLTAPTEGVGPLYGTSRRVRATVPNPSFEIGTQSNGRGISNESSYEGWHAEYTADGGYSEVFVWNRNGTYNNTGAWPPIANTMPDGDCALALKKNASAWTEIDVPEDGVYRLSFYAGMRFYEDFDRLGHRLELAVGDAEPSVFGHFMCVACDNVYRPYSYRLPFLAKGKHKLWFRSPGDNDDRMTLIDCVSVEREESDDDWLLPNGNFESLSSVKGVFANVRVFTNANAGAVCGWTLTQPDAVTPFNQVAPATPQMYASSKSNYAENPGWLYNMPEGDGSAVNLQLCHGGSASCTFTPPVGTWRLRVDARTFKFQNNDDDYIYFRATATVDETVTDLGTVNHIGTHRTQADTFPVAMTFDGTESVTIKLWCEKTGKGSRSGNATAAHLGLDNVRLAPVRDNLVKNGSFENGWTDWTQEYFTTNKWGDMKCEILDLTQNSNMKAYGANPPDGKCALRLLADDIVKQDVTFPKAGDYRLEAIMHSRYDGHGENPTRAWYQRGGVTNEIFGFFIPVATNFIRYAWNFRVAEAGTYEFAFEGGSKPEPGSRAGVDKTTLVDAVSIVPIRLKADVPTVGADMRIIVSEGAKLRLDYPGTTTVSRLSYNGTPVKGLLTAASAPDFVTGPGALMVVPSQTNGLLFVVR